MFDKKELEIWWEQGKISAEVMLILEQCADDEPDLMQYWVYALRIKRAPMVVQEVAESRMMNIVSQTGMVYKNLRSHVFDKVCNAIWNRLSDEERGRWLRSI